MVAVNDIYIYRTRMVGGIRDTVPSSLRVAAHSPFTRCDTSLYFYFLASIRLILFAATRRVSKLLTFLNCPSEFSSVAPSLCSYLAPVISRNCGILEREISFPFVSLATKDRSFFLPFFLLSKSTCKICYFT